jgi:hypothetical protein
MKIHKGRALSHKLLQKHEFKKKRKKKHNKRESSLPQAYEKT